MQTQIRQVLEGSHLFTGLGRDLIDQIEASVSRRSLGADQILFQKGDRADALWGVLSGRVVVEVRTEDGKEMVLDAFEEGEVFGEVGVLDFGPRRVEARATEPSELFRLERKHFLRHLQSSPELCFRVFSLLCSHLRDTTENLEDTALYKLPNRLAKRLTMLSADSGGGDTVLHIMQSELAAMLGVNRETVNRNLRAFEKDGLIALKRQRIEIADPEALAELAAPWQADMRHQWGNGELGALKSDAFTSAQRPVEASARLEPHSAGLLAVDAAEYSRALMSDAAGTLKRIKAGLDAVDRSIELYQGHVLWNAGDRVLAEFPDARMAMRAALAIQEQVDSTARAGQEQTDSLFRIGVHVGQLAAADNRFLGQAVNTAIRLTQLSGAGGVAISGAVRDALDNTEQLQLRFLGHHELKNVPATVPVYSARSIPLFKLLALRAGTLVPRRFRPAAVAAAALMLLAGIWFVGDRMGRQSTPLAVSQLSIAVLPFATVGDSALDYLSEGIPGEVRAALSLIPGMRVIGRESSRYFNDREANPEEIGRELEVAWLVGGRVERAGDRIQATARLMNASTSELVWEEDFLGSEGGPFGLGPKITHRVTASLGITDIDGAALPRLLPLTTDREAYALYLEAQSHIWRGRGRNAVKAVPLLQAAVELDPSFAEAHAVLASLYADLSLLDDQLHNCPQPCPVGPSGETFTPELREELARQSLQTALSLAPDSPLVLGVASEARQREDDFEGARALAERALRIDPNNTAALWALHMVQWSQSDWAGTLQSSERMIRLEPLSVGAMNWHWNNLYDAGRHAEALAITERAFSLYPEDEVPHFHGMMGASKLELGDRVGALESHLQGLPYGYYHLWAGLENDWEFVDEVDPIRSIVTLVYVGEYDRIRQILIDEFGIDDPNSRWAKSTDYLINRGELEVLAGNFVQAIEIFEQARPLMRGEDVGLFWASGEGNFNAYLSWARKSSPALALLYAYRQTGQDEKAEEIADLIRRGIAGRRALADAKGARGEHKLLYREAQLMAIEGPPEAGLDALRRWRWYDPEQFNYPRNDPFLSGLHDEPEFWEIIGELEAELAETRVEFHARQAALAEAGGG